MPVPSIMIKMVLLNGQHKLLITRARLNSFFRIEKGTLDVNDSGVNDYFKPEDIRIPFRNMVYIGDSDTDIPLYETH